MNFLTKLLALCFVLLLPSSNIVNAESSESSLLISEVQTGSNAVINAANEEFIELYNNSVLPIDLSNWKLEYHPATRTNFDSPSQSIQLTGVLYPGKYYLLTRTGYLVDLADGHFTQAIAESGGHLCLVKTELLTTTVGDILGWGSAKLPEDVAAAAAGDGKSLERKQTETGLQDTDNNKEDFTTNISPSPASDNESPEITPSPEEELPAEIPAEEPVETEETPPTETITDEPEIVLLPLQITELLPNPSAPATDDQDEFIEIYNPNDVPVDITGYVLEAGSSFSYHFVIPDESLPPKGYAVFYSKDNNLALSNTTGRARLLDTNGVVASQTDLYDEAEEGQTWSLIDGVWRWSTTATPDAANVLTLPPLPEPKIAKVPLPKSSVKKEAKPKVASAKTASAKKTSANKNTPKANASDQAADALAQTPSIHPLVLGGVGSLALLYGAYEYRYDIRNYLRRFRRN